MHSAWQVAGRIGLAAVLGAALGWGISADLDWSATGSDRECAHASGLCFGTAGGAVRLWNPATGQPVAAPLPASTGQSRGVNGVAFSPDGKILATASADNTVSTWQISLFVDPYAALCADVGRPTKANWMQYAPGEPQPKVCG